MRDARRLSPLQSYGGSDVVASLQKHRHSHRVLLKLSVALTSICTVLFLIVCVPHLHRHFYLISGSSASAPGVQYSPGDLAGLSDRIVPYQTRIGYFTYAKPLGDDRVIAVLPPRFVPGADVRDQVPSLRGARPAAREEYVDDLYPVVLHVSPKIPSGGGEVSLMGLRFGSAGSVCQCIFGGAAAISCVVKSPELAIIQLPAAPHFQVFREANAQPAFVEVKLVAGNHVGVSRIHFGSDSDSNTESSHARALPPSHAAASQQVVASKAVAAATASGSASPAPPYKEVSNVTTEDIERIIDVARKNGVA